MLVSIAIPAELAEVVLLVNAAYRGAESKAGWTNEAAIIEGRRIDLDGLRADLARNPSSEILILRLAEAGPIVGCVRLDRIDGGACYLGMLAISPTLQARHLGAALLTAAEAHARSAGACRIDMTVIQVRQSLIAWYERRGYGRTGETVPFPYGDPGAGSPLRDDLHLVVLQKPLAAG